VYSLAFEGIVGLIFSIVPLIAIHHHWVLLRKSPSTIFDLALLLTELGIVCLHPFSALSAFANRLTLCTNHNQYTYNVGGYGDIMDVNYTH
jgi:hypothetical protein